MTGPHGFINIGPTTSRRSTIDQLVDVITHLVKENDDLKETNATLIKQSIVAPGNPQKILIGRVKEIKGKKFFQPAPFIDAAYRSGYSAKSRTF